MKVISFNIRYRDDENGHTIKERSFRLKTILDSKNASLVGLQECTPEWLEYLQRDYAENYEIFNCWRIGYESTPIMIKKDEFEILDKGCFWLSNTPEIPSNGWDTIGCNRICTWAELKENSSGKKLLFLNTHLGFGEDGQCKSIALIRSFAEKYADIPVVLTGDFNMETTFPAYRQAINYFTDANQDNPSVTFHGYNLPENNPKLIDYIFLKNAKSNGYVLLNETFDGKFPSDHFGILSNVEI